MTQPKYSEATIETRRRSIGRRLASVGIELQRMGNRDLKLLTMVEVATDAEFLTDKERESIAKLVSALDTISKNLGVIGGRMDK